MSHSDKQVMEEIAVYWTNAQPAVSAFISSMVPKFQDAADILQQVAVTVVKNYGKYDKKHAFTGWVIGIAKNEILTHWRKHSKGKFIFDTETVEKISEAYERESGKVDDIREALDICIKKLKGRGKQILEMRYLSELSVSRIAQKLGMTHGSVYTSLHRIRLALQECIGREMLTEDRGNV